MLCLRRERLTTSRDLLAGSGDTNDDALTPALVAGLEGAAHDVHVTGAVEGVVETAVGHVDESGLDGLALLEVLGRVDEVGGAELLGPLLLSVVDVDNNDLAGTVLDRTLDDTETDAAGAEDGDGGTLLDTALAGGDHGSTVTGGDTAAEQASAVHGGLLGDGDNGDVGNDGVLREGRAAHEVEEVLALALEARGAVGHDTLALSCADGTAEVGLAGLAELALLALSGAVDPVSNRLGYTSIAPEVRQLLITRRRGRTWANSLERDDMVALLHVRHTLANALDDTSTLVTGDDGEGTLGVLAAHHVGIRVADTGVVDLNADLVGFGRCHLDVLNAEVLGGTPGNGGLASDGLTLGRHDSCYVMCCLFARFCAIAVSVAFA